MQTGMHVALSGQIVLQRKLDAIAHNVANANTPGYRAQEITFASIFAQTGEKETAFAGSGGDYTSLRTGGLLKTDNPLDVGVLGDAWLAVKTPTGTAYTKDGRMQMLDSGELRTMTGLQVLDVSGSALTLDPANGPARISRDGMITQNGAQVGAIGLFQIDKNAKLSAAGTSGFTTDKPATPVLDFVKNGVAQGFIESSNVNPVMEMARLIAVQRTFESVSAAIDGQDTALRDAIRSLGSS
ncbi:MAG: flagellar basal-body rod protein FlgF [Beijerinckiaceae bacterium]|nr:flagellar basal-body rod protein FlgF [Beijerinckiaceae bacterium]MDO9441289.1 flagellar basal-body rod protein FlgF [Beijerinckiaceae bacterium]